MKAREIMRRDVDVITPNDSIANAAELMHYAGDASVPVVLDSAKPVLLGIITGRDIAVRCVARRHSPSCLAGTHMTPMPLKVLHPDDDIAMAARIMDDTEVRRVPVIDSDGLLLGVIHEVDLRRAMRAEYVARTPALEATARLGRRKELERPLPATVRAAVPVGPDDMVFHENRPARGIS